MDFCAYFSNREQNVKMGARLEERQSIDNEGKDAKGVKSEVFPTQDEESPRIINKKRFSASGDLNRGGVDNYALSKSYSQR